MGKQRKGKKGRAALLALAIVAMGAGAVASGIAIRDRVESGKTDGGGALDVIWQKGIKPAQNEIQTTRDDATGQTTVVIPYTVEPAGTTFKNMTVALKWEDGTVQDSVAETMTATVDADAKKVTLKGLKDFSNFIVCEVKSEDAPSVGFAIRCHCAQRFMGFDPSIADKTKVVIERIAMNGDQGDGNCTWSYIKQNVMNEMTGGKGYNLSELFTPGDGATVTLSSAPESVEVIAGARSIGSTNRDESMYNKTKNTTDYVMESITNAIGDNDKIITFETLKSKLLTDISSLSSADKNTAYKAGIRRTACEAMAVNKGTSQNNIPTLRVKTHAADYAIELKTLTISFVIVNAPDVLNNYGAVPMTAAAAESGEAWF